MDVTAGEISVARLLSTETEAADHRPLRARILARGALVVGLVLVIALVVPVAVVHLEKAELLDSLQRRGEIQARGRAQVIATWLDGVTRPADRVVESELFRLFATEMDLSGGDISDMATAGAPGREAPDAPLGLGVPLAAQLPFMEQVLTDFAKNAEFISGHLIDRRGVAYVASAGADPLTAEQQRAAAEVFGSGVLHYGPARGTAAGLVMDIFAPIFRAQSDGGSREPVGVLLLTAPIGAMLSELAAPPPLSEPGERLRLVQVQDGESYVIEPGEAPPLRPIAPIEAQAPDWQIAFDERSAIGGGAAVYSVGTAVAGPAWWVIQETDVAAVEDRLRGFIGVAATVAALAVLAVIAAFGAFWWRFSNEHNAALAEQFRHLALRIEAQKALLDSINDSIVEFIGLKGSDGAYRYVNPAFARALGRDVDKVVGLDDAAIFGQGTAERLRLSDQRALAARGAVTVSEDVYLGGRLRHVQFSKAPYRDGEDGRPGIVVVARDVTELVEQQKKKERAIQQMVAGLVRAVELRDPYLAGHSRRLAGFATAVAQRLNATPEQVAAIEIAANLSQIGKLAVPRKILNKPERLGESEVAQVRRHADHAVTILRDIDFELPVLDAIYKMHERLDGGGYPQGLTAEQIPLTARILGACDVFCARIEPRAYRAGIAPEAALAVLEQNSERYDPTVVAALRQVTGTVAGDKLIAGAAAD